MVDPLVKFHNEVWGSFSDNPKGQGHFCRYCVMFYSFRIAKFRETCPLVASKYLAPYTAHVASICEMSTDPFLATL